EQHTRGQRGSPPAPRARGEVPSFSTGPCPVARDGKVDIEQVDFADKNVLALFCRGETKGIFQFESPGMQDLLIKMCPDRIEDLIAANALYRPGPMELIPLY